MINVRQDIEATENAGLAGTRKKRMTPLIDQLVNEQIEAERASRPVPQYEMDMQAEANMFPQLLDALRATIAALSKHKARSKCDDAEVLRQARLVVDNAERLNESTRFRNA